MNPSWTSFTEGWIHGAIRRTIVALACHAVRYPIAWIVSVSIGSLAVVTVGLLTNFQMELDQMVFLTPKGSLPDRHSAWIKSPESGFENVRVFWLALHSNGDNVLHAQAMRQAIQLMTVVKAVPDYGTVCSQSQYLEFPTDEPTCRVFSVSHFWGDDLALLDEVLAFTDDSTTYVQRTVSGRTYPDETPVFHEAILGNYQNSTHGVITSAQALIVKIDIPDLGLPTDKLEMQMLDTLADLKESWLQMEATRDIHLEYFTFNAYQAEFQRAVDQDIPLVLVLIIVMVSFTCLVFYRPGEKVESRAMLGIFAFVTIGCSLLSGYGIMFCAGVPLTNIGIMIPFVVVGIALDDTFIICGAFFRIRRDKPTVPIHDLIEETMEEVAVSISMTTVTTLLCFFLGLTSSIPAVDWLCLYAGTTIAVDFFYQITYFVALLTLDERRVRANRRDICFWIIVNNDVDEEDQGEKEESDNPAIGSDWKSTESEFSSRETFTPEPEQNTNTKYHGMKTAPHVPLQDQTLTERWMGRYADFLGKGWVKVMVLLAFSAYFGGCVYSTTLLYQEFNAGDYVPEDSFLTSFMVVFDQYTTINRFIGVYFRDVDQSDPAVQQQMSNYVKELSDLPQIGAGPPFFWVRDFAQLAASEQAAELGIDLVNLTFNEQIDLALSIPQIRQIFAQDIVRDKESGNITASRTYLSLRNIDLLEVSNQVDMLKDQLRITLAQTANSPDKVAANGGNLHFFTFDDMYYFWQLYAVVVGELISTTVSCVVVVSLVAALLIPHWSAILFMVPLIIVLYFSLMGTMQYCGIKINSVTYFIIVMSIGLLVDFVMHVLLRYYESKKKTRQERVKDTLETIGCSILLGGFTTWLGVIPLAFSTTKIFMTVFISFLAMVMLGCAVGLILLPVLLSIAGPEGPGRPENYDVVEMESRDDDGYSSQKSRGLQINANIAPELPPLEWQGGTVQVCKSLNIKGFITADGTINLLDVFSDTS